MCFTDIGFHQESYFNMFESDNKMKIYLSCLLLENTWSYLSTKLFQPQVYNQPKNGSEVLGAV